MKQISFWAKRYVWPSRIIIIISHILLTIIAIYWGVQSFKVGFNLNESLLYALILLYFSLYFIYPTTRSKTILKNTHTVRLWLHSVMALCSFMMVFSYTNVKMQPTTIGSASAAVSIKIDKEKRYKSSEAERLINSYKNGEVKKFTRTDRKVLREELKYQFQKLKEAKKAGQKAEGSDALKIIITILVALLLLFGVASLSCNLSCSGNDGAAVAVLVLGIAAIIFGVIMIFRGKNKKKVLTDEPKTTQPA